MQVRRMGLDAFSIETFDGVFREKCMAAAVANELLVERQDKCNLARHDFHVVRHEDDRQPQIGIQGFEQGIEFFLGRHIDTRSRFIEDEKLRIGSESACNEDSLPFPAGERSYKAVAHMRDIRPIHRFLDCFVIMLGMPSPEADS